MKGIFEFEVEGRKVGFKFGTYAISVACEKEGDCSIDVLFRRCGIPYMSGKEIRQDKPKLKSLLHLFYGAAIHFAEDNDQPTDFKPSTVSNWLDAIGLEKVNQMMTEGLNQYTPKNSPSPEKAGEEVTV